MKKLLLLVVLYGSFFTARCQTGNEDIKLDLLKAPASPASNLLGIAASDIDKPTDVSAFMVSLQTATNSFTTLPSSYAIDIAPYWLFKKPTGDVTTKGLAHSGGPNVFKQTFVLSFAIKNTDSTESVYSPNSLYAGMGFKFFIRRGDYDSVTIASLTNIKALQDKKLALLQAKLSDYSTDPAILNLQFQRKSLLSAPAKEAVDNLRNSEGYGKLSAGQKQAAENTLILSVTDSVRKTAEYNNIDAALQKRVDALKQTDAMEADEQIKAIAAAFQTARVGFTWDIAGGMSGRFLNKRFDDSRVYNAGLWTTFGYTSKKCGSILGLLRGLYNPDKIFAKDNGVNDIGDITTLDAGLRYIYSRPQSKFNASLEAVYRSVLSTNTIDPSWRLVFNADYAIWQNQKLTFSFGRNFDGTITKDGNLVAALTFLTGFGNKR